MAVSIAITVIIHGNSKGLAVVVSELVAVLISTPPSRRRRRLQTGRHRRLAVVVSNLVAIVVSKPSSRRRRLDAAVSTPSSAVAVVSRRLPCNPFLLEFLEFLF
jgi:hypothetical protein